MTLQLAWHSVTSLARDDGALAEDGRSAASSTLDPDSSTRDAAKSGKATRMLVIVFDALDYRLAFPERPEFTDLPELDRFSKQAIVFTIAPVAETHTLKAISTLLVGKRISGAQVRDRKTLVLNVEGAEEGRSLSSLPNLFSEVRNSGHTLSIVGFYHPHCRLFRGLYAECMRLTLNDPYHREDQGGTTGNFRRRFEAALMFGSPLAHKTGAMRNYGIVLQRVKEMVHRFDVNLIYVHLQVPHTPFIYDARRRREVQGIVFTVPADVEQVDDKAGADHGQAVGHGDQARYDARRKTHALRRRTTGRCFSGTGARSPFAVPLLGRGLILFLQWAAIEGPDPDRGRRLPFLHHTPHPVVSTVYPRSRCFGLSPDTPLGRGLRPPSGLFRATGVFGISGRRRIIQLRDRAEKAVRDGGGRTGAAGTPRPCRTPNHGRREGGSAYFRSRIPQA